MTEVFMPDPTLAELSQRLQTVETQVRRWRAMFLGALVLPLAALLLAAKGTGVQDEVAAHTFTLLNKQGNPRGKWFIDEKSGSPIFSMVSKDQQARFGVDLDANDIPAMIMYDAQGQKAIMTINPNGDPFLILSDAHRGRTSVEVGVDGPAGVFLHDAEGNLRGAFGLPNGNPDITFFDKGKEGKVIWRAPN
jgi:hypothetical protein